MNESGMKDKIKIFIRFLLASGLVIAPEADQWAVLPAQASPSTLGVIMGLSHNFNTLFPRVIEAMAVLDARGEEVDVKNLLELIPELAHFCISKEKIDLIHRYAENMPFAQIWDVIQKLANNKLHIELDEEAKKFIRHFPLFEEVWRKLAGGSDNILAIIMSLEQEDFNNSRELIEACLALPNTYYKGDYIRPAEVKPLIDFWLVCVNIIQPQLPMSIKFEHGAQVDMSNEILCRLFKAGLCYFYKQGNGVKCNFRTGRFLDHNSAQLIHDNCNVPYADFEIMPSEAQSLVLRLIPNKVYHVKNNGELITDNLTLFLKHKLTCYDTYYVDLPEGQYTLEQLKGYPIQIIRAQIENPALQESALELPLLLDSNALGDIIKHYARQPAREFKVQKQHRAVIFSDNDMEFVFQGDSEIFESSIWQETKLLGLQAGYPGLKLLRVRHVPTYRSVTLNRALNLSPYDLDAICSSGIFSNPGTDQEVEIRLREFLRLA